MGGGIVLLGTEVKSLRDKRAQITDAYAVVKDGELWLLNAHIAPYTHGNVWNHRPHAHAEAPAAKEGDQAPHRAIERKGLTLVALDLYFKQGRAKVKIGLAAARSCTTSVPTRASATTSARSSAR